MIRFYFDHHVPAAVVDGLRRRGVDVLTAFEDGYHDKPDEQLLSRATELQRVLFSQDSDLLIEAHRRIQSGEPFLGVVYVHALDATIRAMIEGLHLLAEATSLEDYGQKVEFLPR
jgi:predicted nuclease of predicted toxin-antitoxin system